MFIFSNWIYCRRCGGTNLWFPKTKDNSRKDGYRIRRVCRECSREEQRNRRNKIGYWRSEKIRAYKRKYREENRERIRELNRLSKRRIKERTLRLNDNALILVQNLVNKTL